MSDTAAQASTSTSASIPSHKSVAEASARSADLGLTDGDLTAAALPVEEQAIEHLCFLAKHANTSTECRLTVEDTVAELKAVLFSMTDIPPERQKILGLVKGRLSDDDTALGDLIFPPTSLRASPNPTTGEKRITITLIGTPIDQTFKDPGAAGVEDDVAAGSGSNDIDYGDPEVMRHYMIEPRHDRKTLAKLRQAISRFSFTFPIMNEPREGKKLLVLDLDYTMADTKRLLNGNPQEALRPGLHEFLAAVYPYYDIVVWSATRHYWLEAKLYEMGCLTNEGYKISFVLDRTPMFNVVVQQRGHEKRKHEVKALEIIWKRFPEHYGPHNTIMCDDYQRNFALNANSGLKITPYKNSPSPDSVLLDLKDYLVRLADSGIKSFEELGGHRHWKKLLESERLKDKEKEKQAQEEEQ